MMPLRNTNKNFVLTVILIYFFNDCYGIEDYCSVNKFSGNGNHMQFTKEPSTAEFAIIGTFKGLHCCAKGYRSIEWYKDGRAYPWHGTVSELIIYPESANQTVYTQTVKSVDAGNYTCLLRNDTVVHTHTIQLTVFDKVPDDPKITYISRNMEVSVGQPARLFCEAFVGRVDLPDAYNEAVWKKSEQNDTLQDEPHIRQEKISREDGQTFGTYLIIDEVTDDDYGEYICTISKPGKTINLSTYLSETTKLNEYINPNPVPFKKILIWGCIILIVLITMLALNLKYGLFIRVHMKDRFGKLQENDSKINDVLIVYSPKDYEIAMGVLLPALESKYNYKCGSEQLSDNMSLWYTNLIGAAQKSRRVVTVLSPACLNEKWESELIYQALTQLHSLDPQLCCVTLKEIPTSENQVKNSQGETLSSLVRAISVINWERSNDERFWLSLRLRLPPKRYNNAEEVAKLENVNSMIHADNSTRLNNSNSRDSLDIFV